ncbi:MAG: hypothetical protein JO208_10540 [Alphaproteobacteria bacterium]|nr:hypothetical protein [Alphaproteobacteria bacterium]
MKYECDPRFEPYYLEDSYVLGVDESDSSRLAFSLLLVLTPRHPLYSAPNPNEQYCYRNGSLTFEGVSAINWADRTFKPVHDAAGEVDYGNIDVFELEPGDRYYLEGDWGRVTVTAKSARIEIAAAS